MMSALSARAHSSILLASSSSFMAKFNLRLNPYDGAREVAVVAAATAFCTPVATTIKFKPVP
jgi:hypothetical protein